MDVRELDLTVAKSGHPTLGLRQNGVVRWIHSQRDPVAEATVLVEQWWKGPGTYLVVGLGLGYHAVQLAERMRGTDSELVVIEPYQKVYDIARSAGTLEALLDAPHVCLVSGTDPWRTLATKNLAASRQVSLCVHPVLYRLFREQYDETLASLRSEINRQLINVRTLLSWDLVWLRNTIMNVPYLVRHPAATVLVDRFTGTPAFIVSAGPSLDKNIGELRKAQGKSVIIAVGTALRAVLKAGITPDFVVSIDGSARNFEHFRGLDYDQAVLVFDPMIHPAILREHNGPKLSVKTYNAVYGWLREVVGAPLQLASGGSVATVALNFAAKLGCDPLVLVGQDLAYGEDGRTHAADTTYGNNRVPVNSAELLSVPGNVADRVVTSRALLAFLTWFERYAAGMASRRRIINATEGGARIPGIPSQGLAETVKRECTREVDGKAVVEESQVHYELKDSTERVAEFVLASIKDLDQLADVARKGRRYGRRLLELVKRNRLASKEASRLLAELARVNAVMQDGSSSKHLVHSALYGTILRVLRTRNEAPDAVDGESLSSTELKSRLAQAIDLYVAVERASTRTSDAMRSSLAAWRNGPSSTQTTTTVVSEGN